MATIIIAMLLIVPFFFKFKKPKQSQQVIEDFKFFKFFLVDFKEGGSISCQHDNLNIFI